MLAHLRKLTLQRFPAGRRHLQLPAQLLVIVFNLAQVHNGLQGFLPPFALDEQLVPQLHQLLLSRSEAEPRYHGAIN